MKNLILSFVFLFSLGANASITVQVQGKVQRIEKGHAVVKSAKGVTRVRMSHVNKKTADLIRNAGSKKQLKFKVAPQAIAGMGEVY